jgi:hypothetical protein
MANTRIRGVCSVPSCGKEHRAKGYCWTHYGRWKAHGDPYTKKSKYNRNPISERIWQYIKKEEFCWRWVYALDVQGYGALKVSNKSKKAHRVVYELLRGPIPENMTLDHLCKNRWCVNPDHMDIVTSGENALRGNGPFAKNKRKTHCKYGHEFVPENIRPTVDKRGNVNRSCLRCYLDGLEKRRVRDAIYSSERL